MIKILEIVGADTTAVRFLRNGLLEKRGDAAEEIPLALPKHLRHQLPHTHFFGKQ